MAKITLIGRQTLREHADALKPFLGVVPVTMAIALAPEDALLAKEKLTEAVGIFNGNTAIIADFPADLVVNEDGSIEPIPLVVDAPEQPSLITEV
jgi:hypothetical protein